MADVLTNAGLAIVTNRIIGSGTEPKYASWGTAAGTAAVGNTTLFTEAMSTQNDGSSHNNRVTGTSSRVTGSQTNDTYQVVATLTADAGKTITNAGLFDSDGLAADLVTATAGGNLFVKSDFTGIALNTGDAIQFTFKTRFS